ncbi:anti-sigma factor [Alkalihalobacillus sp. AL-G]|uniref:anti-sigma factor n=1 Tax=Alkalihalobacillus sp. AL-G TaxID=2926399 RepID=UPI00272D16CE|nr:anti-sigma factor [Alkalihalobacillus sp. AL-G]WLD94602.1 anti-sigma factor [Alkalihalobacillus sp. AL-G]
MSEDFKKKLEAYSNGELLQEEQVEIENELDKMEVYQSYLDNLVNTHDQEQDNGTDRTKKQKSLITRGKWRARFQNAWTALSILIIILFIGWGTSVIFYTWGEPADRSESYIDVIKATIETTQPNITVGSSGMNVGLFTMNYDAELRKWIGSDHETIGELDSKFLFNLSSIQLPDDIYQHPFFIYPEQQEQLDPPGGFEVLERLPEGTVSELFISLSDYYETNEILKKFEGENMWPTWFAVDTGFEQKDEIRASEEPLGFPLNGYHFLSEYQFDSKNGEFILKAFGGAAHSKSRKVYGDGEERNEEFFKALLLMKKYYSIADDIHWSSEERLSEQIEYIDENGTKIYGVVVNGPTKELLKLKDEDWVGSAVVGEKRLWNWRDVN